MISSSESITSHQFICDVSSDHEVRYKMAEKNSQGTALPVRDKSEDENVTFWDLDSQHSSPRRLEGLKKPTLSPSALSYSRIGGETEAIGPIIGKNLFNDPRKAQSNQARRTLTSTVKSPRRTLHRSLTNLCPPTQAYVGASPPRSVPHHRKATNRPNANRNQMCLSGVGENYSTVHEEDTKMNSNCKPTDSWLPSVLLDKGESEKMTLFVDRKLPSQNGVSIYHSTGNLLNLDYVDANPVAHRRVNKLIESSTYVSSQGNESSSSDSGYRSKQSDIHKDKKALNSSVPTWKEDDNNLCADIEACDTLFLDIGGTKEPPELKAARNLKDRIKKKKSSKEKMSLEESNVNQNTVTATSSNSSPDKLQSVNDVSVSVEKSGETGECAIKIKKKIKIVIGRKPKPKLLRKKSLTDQMN